MSVKIVPRFLAVMLSLGPLLHPQAVQIPSRWFSSAPLDVLADPSFYKFRLTVRRQVLAQIDPKFARMKPEKQESYLWDAEMKYLPKAAPPKEVIVWTPTDPNSASELPSSSGSVITKTISARGYKVRAYLEKQGFFRAHVTLANTTSEPVLIHPQRYLLTVLKPKLATLCFQYPERVSYQWLKSVLNISPNYETIVRSGTGEITARIETPDPILREKADTMSSTLFEAGIALGMKIEPESLKEGELGPDAIVEGNVWFQGSNRAREVMLRIFISEIAFDLPFVVP